MVTYRLSVGPPPLLPLPAPEDISTRLLSERQPTSVTAFFAGYIPGRGADGAEHVPAQRRGHVHDPAWARDLERVRVDVVIPVCAGRDICESRSGSGSGVYTVLGQSGWHLRYSRKKRAVERME